MTHRAHMTAPRKPGRASLRELPPSPYNIRMASKAAFNHKIHFDKQNQIEDRVLSYDGAVDGPDSGITTLL